MSKTKKAKPGSQEIYERRMRPAKRAVVRKEFDEAIADMSYESLLGSKAMEQYLFELFVFGWGAKTRQVKRKEKRKAKDGDIRPLVVELIKFAVVGNGDSEDDHCKICNSSLYENMGSHMDDCPIPPLAAIFDIPLPTPTK